MSSRFRRFQPVVALAILALAACATTVGEAPAADRSEDPATDPTSGPSLVEIEVQNNLLPSTPVQVYARPDDDERRLLGTVPGGDRTRLRLRARAPTRRMQLTARADGAEIVSDPFVPSEVARLAWNLMTNELSTLEPAADPG